jgi:uncharacterized protein YggE
MMVAVAVVLGLAVAAAIVVCLSFAGMGAGWGQARGSYPYTYQQTYSAQGMRTITLTASGSASASPETAEVQVSMNATGATPALAEANLSSSVALMNSTVLPFLNGNTSKIQTTSYQIQQATNCTYDSSMPYYCITHRLPYYVASESFEITVPKIGNSSGVITGLSRISGLELDGVQAALSADQQSSLNQQALSAALANATSQAQLLAGEGTPIEVENITVQSSEVYYPYGVFAGAAVAAPKATNSSAMFFGGVSTTQKSIRVVFAIK